MPTNKKTKIVATLGPATSTKSVLKDMIEAGVDVFRINFSHADYKDVAERIQMIRDLNDELGTYTSILADLQGPKIRVGEISGGTLELIPNDILTFVNTPCIGDRQKIYLSYQNFANDVNVGEKVLVDDGKLEFEVVETNKKDTVKLKCLFGGVLSSNKGVNLPNTKISLPSMTPKD